jgi:hypothetical protein
MEKRENENFDTLERLRVEREDDGIKPKSKN